MLVVSRRGQAEDTAGSGDEGESERTRQAVLKWLGGVGLKGICTSEERRVLGIPVGLLDSQTTTDAQWRNESLGVLLWALRMVEGLSPYDVRYRGSVGAGLPVAALKAEIDSFVRSAYLRKAAEIEDARSVAETWHWRSRTRRLQEEGRVPPASMNVTFDQIIEMAAQAAVNRGALNGTSGRDFLAMGKAYRELTDDEFSILTSIAMERHRALNWLCGYGRDLENVPTPT